MSVIFTENDNDVVLQGMRLASSQSFISDATLEFTLKDAGGSPVTGATSVTMDFQSGSNGEYRGSFAETVSLTEGAQYTVEMTSSNYGIKIVRTVTARQRS